MQCPKCNKDTCVMVTTQNKKKVREKQGVVTAAVGLVGGVAKTGKRILVGKKENFAKQNHWHCNYCGNNFADKPENE